MSLAEKKELRKEMTPYQKGYQEALDTSLNRNKVLRNIGYKVSPAIMMSESEKKGFKKGAEDTEKALKYKKNADTAKRKETYNREKKYMGKKAGGMLKSPDNPGLKKLPTEVRNKMGYMKKGGAVKKCKRDGVCIKGKTKGRMV